ncbi:MAG: transcription termination factor Rho [Verrucomicrobiales bacterium]|nr:transcription termination factor Rho [Verrucomicrobiales bacterium]
MSSETRDDTQSAESSPPVEEAPASPPPAGEKPPESPAPVAESDAPRAPAPADPPEVTPSDTPSEPAAAPEEKPEKSADAAESEGKAENRDSGDSGDSRSENQSEKRNNNQNQNQNRRGNNRRGKRGGRNRRGGNRDKSESGENQQQEGGDSPNESRKSRKERYRERKEKERQREAEILAAAPEVESEGLVEISPKGFGFLRERKRNFEQSPKDVFITPEVVRIHGLRDGLWVKCMSKEGVRGPQLIELQSINGREPEEYHNLPYFEELTAINPNKKLTLETNPNQMTTRVIDMMAPIGRGQRGLIVAPPRTGKTTFLHHMADAIIENYEHEMHLMVLLIDERPEEVTDFQRSFPKAEVFASSNDSDAKSHTRIAMLAIERAKRLVEAGEHVFILMDSITRLARSFNTAMRGGKGRGTASGGLTVGALEIPRKLFAAARNTREAGSLTIVATALVQTNSRADDAIFQEFKGTGNMELVLDRQLAQNYVYPAVDIHKSGTRREELLLAGHQLEKIHVIRRGLAGYKPMDAMEWLLKCMERYQSNAQMLMDIKMTAVA